MSAKAARGAKRKCQNEDCLAPFYDLGREEFECPACGTAFDHELAAQANEPQGSRYPSRKQPRDLPIVASEEPENSVDDIDLEADDSDDDDKTVASDVLLEDEEDDDDFATSIEVPAANENDET